MHEKRHLPDVNRLSVLLSIILITYACLPYINIPERSLDLGLFGVSMVYSYDISLLVYLILAIFSAIGIDWLVSDHPNLKRKMTYQHWLLPSFTSWVIGFSLNTIKVGLEWWVVFAFGAVLLALIFISEYIVVDFNDENFNLAANTLTSLSFALYLILAISIRGLGLRLYLLLPTLVFPLFLIALRTYYLHFHGKTKFAWAVAITIVMGQFITGLHYLPLSAKAFGLITIAPVYALIRISISLDRKQSNPIVYIEPALMMLLLFSIAIFLK